MRRWLVLVLVLLSAAESWGATRYLSPTGSDAALGTTTGTAWRTWAYAFGQTSCGDTLIVMDGVYPITTYGVPTLAKTCTASTRYVIQSQNQRQAQISSDGSNYALLITGSAYVTIDGLYFRSADNNCCSGSNFENVSVQNSSFITITNSVVSHNNRYQNTAMIRLQNTDDSLVEDTELYSYHRHGLQFGGNSDRNVARRVYCNSRGYADISGGFPSGFATRGDSCVINYPTGGTTIAVDNVVENSISEGNGTGFWGETYNGPHRGKWYGNISFNDMISLLLKARGASLAQQPYQDDVRDFIGITPVGVCIQLRGNRETSVTNALCYDSSSNAGFLTDVEDVYPGSGIYSFTGTNLLSVLNTTGFLITEMPTWTCENCKAFSNSTNYNPSSSVNYTPVNPPTATDPQLGACRVWRPDGSAAKTNNWGADILYRYVDGVLTTEPLWDVDTGAFPHGALVTGVNDVSGSSLYDVYTRLNVNTGGCVFPSGYGVAGGGGGVGTLTLTRYRFYKAYGDEDAAPAAGGDSQSINIITGGIFRLRMELTASVDTTAAFTPALFCQKNAAGYTRVLNTTGAHGIRLYGGGVNPDMPSSLTPTTKRFDTPGNFVSSVILRNEDSVYELPALQVGDITEIEFVGVITSSKGDVTNCRIQHADGTQLASPAVTPTMATISPQAAVGF